MNRLWIALLILSAPLLQAADRITATVTFTNAAANNDTFVINGTDTRTFKTTVATPASEVLVGGSANEQTTNLVAHLYATPPSGVVVYQLGADSFRLDARTAGALVITGSGADFSVTYSTQTVATAYNVIVPYTSMPSVRRQTITEGIVDWLNLASGKAIFENSASVSNLVGLTNSQTIAGAKQFANTSGQWRGIVSNSPAISGNVDSLTNGTWRNGSLSGTNSVGVLRLPLALQTATDVEIWTNTYATYGFPPASDAGIEWWGPGDSHPAFGAVDGGPFYGFYGVVSWGLTVISNSFSANNAYLIYDADNGKNFLRATNPAFAGAYSDLTATGIYTTGTNSFSDIAFRRYAITSLANGNNAGVVVGTNTFVEVSGPSAAFTLNGMTGSPSRDGHLVIIVNQTGFDWTVAHQSGTDPTAANRIITMTGADRTTTGNGAATFIYSAAASRWLLISFDP